MAVMIAFPAGMLVGMLTIMVIAMVGLNSKKKEGK